MSRPPERFRLPLLVGWLFADLMMLLFVLGLSLAPAGITAGAAKSSPSPTVSRTPTVSPTPSVTPSERVLDRQYYAFDVSVSLPGLQQGNTGNAAARQLISGANNQISQLIAQHPALAGKAIGVAVIFGAGPINAIGIATKEAGIAGDILRRGDPVFNQASILPEWIGNDTPSFAKFIVFFYAS